MGDVAGEGGPLWSGDGGEGSSGATSIRVPNAGTRNLVTQDLGLLKDWQCNPFLKERIQ